MKKLSLVLKIAGVVLLTAVAFLTVSCSSAGSVGGFDETLQGSYYLQDLDSYGEWIHIDNYGNVWRPYAVNDWMPFDNGHWTYADGNWTWVSYEPFGWIVYHYGDWYDDPFYGWVWIPGDGEWSPANVVWLNYGDYIGWAPRPPHGIVYGRPWERNENRYWHVVRVTDFTKDNIRDYRVTNITRDNNGGREVITRPPDRQFIERNIGKQIPEVRIQRQPVKLPEATVQREPVRVPARKIERMNLPQQENRRVEQNSPRVRKEVLVPRDEFHRQQNEKGKNKK